MGAMIAPSVMGKSGIGGGGPGSVHGAVLGRDRSVAVRSKVASKNRERSPSGTKKNLPGASQALESSHDKSRKQAGWQKRNQLAVAVASKSKPGPERSKPAGGK